MAGDETFAVSVDFTPLRTDPQILLVSITIEPRGGGLDRTSHFVFPNTSETRSDFAFEFDLAASTKCVKQGATAGLTAGQIGGAYLQRCVGLR